MDGEEWGRVSAPERLSFVNRTFGERYIEVPSGGFVDTAGFRWCYVPGASFDMGLGGAEEAAARRLAEEPLLTMEEMRPVRHVRVEGFLAATEPLTARQIAALGGKVLETIGPRETGIVDESELGVVDRIGLLPLEEEWEYACRGGSTTLFWFGDMVPADRRLSRILGLEDPATPNAFGLQALFFGEWTRSPWKATLDSMPVTPSERVVRGGAARFWPWQMDEEWAGCVSAYRMPAKDLGGHGAVIRPIRHPR